MRTEEVASISLLIDEMPSILRDSYPVKDDTLRARINKKCKSMDKEGYLAMTTEPAAQGFRYIFTRVQGAGLIPNWFTDLVKPAKMVKEGKVTCKNCGYRENCMMRHVFTTHKREGTLTKEVKKDLNSMCKAVRGSMRQIEDDMKRRSRR